MTIKWRTLQKKIKTFFIFLELDKGQYRTILREALQQLWKSQRRVAGKRCSNVGAVVSGGPPALDMHPLLGREAEAQKEAAITSIGSAGSLLSEAASLSWYHAEIIPNREINKHSLKLVSLPPDWLFRVFASGFPTCSHLEWAVGKPTISNAQCTMPNNQFPIPKPHPQVPNSQCQMHKSNVQCPMINTQSSIPRPQPILWTVTQH